MAYLAYSLIWLSTTAGVCCAVYVTQSAWPLLAFIFPAGVSFTSGEDKKGEKNE